MDDIIEFRGLLAMYGWERDFAGPLDDILTRNEQRIEISWDELKAMGIVSVIMMLKSGQKTPLSPPVNRGRSE